MDSRSTPPPANIGRFRIDAVLGSGGMGAVYKGFDPTLQRTIAIKTVRPDIDRPDFIERLIREAQACARLRHANIVTIHEAGQIDGMVYIVMEYLQGEDLAAVLRRGGLTLESKIRILVQILDALAHTHREGVIHRDIKPSNVHCQPDGSIKLVDFGLARVESAEPLTRSGTLMCTPEYASPEQVRGEALDGRTDIYSTGVLAYEMVSGRRPFVSDTGSVGAVILKVMSDPPPPMDTWWIRKFPEVERIVFRAMAKSPLDRFQSADEMKLALVTFLDSSRGAIAEAQAEADAGNRESVLEAPTAGRGVSGADDEGTRVNAASPAIADGDATGGAAAPGVVSERPAAGALASPLPASQRPTTTHPRSPQLPTAPLSQPPTTTGGPPSQAPTTAQVRRSQTYWWLASLAASVLIVAIVKLSRPSPPTGSRSPGAVPAPAAAAVSQGPVTSLAPAAANSSSAPTGSGDGAANGSASPAVNQPTGGTTVPSAGAASAAIGAAPAQSAASNVRAGAGIATPNTPARDAGAKALFSATPDSAAEVVNAGLRYRLTRRTADGVEADVDPTTTTFRSGDRVRFAFESNVDAYLYVVQQGSSGRWTVLFPGPRINGGKNAVRRNDEYLVPSNDWFLFDATPGTEQVFVLLSREPLNQLPGFDRPVTKTETVVASVVEDLQSRIKSRDLVFEKDAAPSTEDGAAVQATYVVNRAELGQTVAASISLIHTP